MKREPIFDINLIIKAGDIDYRRSINRMARGLWTGTFDLWQFENQMAMAIDLGFRRAWFRGASDCGISQGELTSEEWDRLYTEIYEESTHIFNFGLFIVENSKQNGGKLGDCLARAQLWGNRYDAVISIARSYACGDQKLKWIMNPVKEHCRDCIRLNGRVYRASIWRKYDIEPRMHRLACGGWRCGCDFIVTDEPVTSGRPPGI